MTNLSLNVHTHIWSDEFPFSLHHLLLTPSDTILLITIPFSIRKFFLQTFELQNCHLYVFVSICCKVLLFLPLFWFWKQTKLSIVYCSIRREFFQVLIYFLLPPDTDCPEMTFANPNPLLKEYFSSGLFLWPIWLPQH